MPPYCRVHDTHHPFDAECYTGMRTTPVADAEPVYTVGSWAVQ